MSVIFGGIVAFFFAIGLVVVVDMIRHLKSGRGS